METLKDIEIGNTNISLSNNRVTGSIIPRNAQEMERDIRVQEKVIIEGGVFARNLEIDNGPVQFNGAIYTNQELHIKNDAKSSIFFKKAVTSKNSVVSLLTAGRAIYGGDINAVTIKLKNCFVAGSLFATEIQLENCVVLGGVFATKKLVLQNVMVGTFNSAEVNVMVGTFNSAEVNAGGVNYFLYPTAFSIEPMSILPGTEFYNLSLADLGALYKEESPKANTGKIRLDIKNDSQRTTLIAEDESTLLVNSYSVASRVLIADLIDIDSLENHFLILGASLGEKILKSYSLTKEDGSEGKALEIPTIAEFFFKILQGKIEVAEIDAKVSFDDLEKMNA